MFNQFKKTALVAAAGLAFAATPAFAQSVSPATADGEARVRILQPLVIDATDGVLDFGVLVKDGALGGTTYDFRVATDGSFGTCDAAWACSGSKQAAGFTVTGAADESVQITVPTTPIDLDGSATDDHLSVVLDLSGDSDFDGEADLPLGATGVATFSVGGTLTVDGDVANGVYSAPFTVSAEYL